MGSETETNDQSRKPRVDRLLARAHAEVAAGRAWRAKEILGGSMSVPQLVIEPNVLEAYGALLDALGDRFQAGKYLFLSGTTAPEHAGAIAIYLGRMSKTPVEAQIAQFPGELCRQGLGYLPEGPRKYLEERGAPSGLTQRREPFVPRSSSHPRKPTHLTGWKAWVVLGVFILILTLLLASIVVGGITIGRWLFLSFAIVVALLL
jgi:hypothetical protein